MNIERFSFYGSPLDEVIVLHRKFPNRYPPRTVALVAILNYLKQDKVFLGEYLTFMIPISPQKAMDVVEDVHIDLGLTPPPRTSPKKATRA